MLTIAGDRFAQLLHDRQWWRLACAAAWRFAPRCLVCSLVLVVANLSVVLVSDRLIGKMKELNGQTITDLTGILAITLTALVALGVILVVSMWALGQWLLNLTAFARAFCLLEQSQAFSASGVRQAVPEAQTAAALDAALGDIKARWFYVLKLWVIASLYLIVPAVPLSVLIALHAMFASTIVDVKAFGWPQWLGGPLAAGSALLVGAILTVLCSAYTFVTIVFSAISPLPPARTASIALRESLKHLTPICGLTVIILLANIVVTAPQMILALTPLASCAKSSAVEVCAQIWLGLTSPFLWPLSVAPFCRIVRLEKESSDQDG